MSYFTEARTRLTGKGQSMVEFALISPIVTFLLVIAFQLALIGQSVLALGQLSSAAAHYAADHASADQSAIADYAQSVASPTLKSNQGNDLAISVSPGGNSRSFGTSVTVSATYSLKSRLIVPNPFFGVTLPESITSASTTFSE